MTTAVIVIYLVVVSTVGAMLSRRATSSDQWAVAGGGMGLSIVAFGIAGTRIGGAGTYGVAERAMSGGLWYMWWYAINTFLAIAIVGFFFAKAYRRLGLHTVSEIFTIRFGSRRAQWMTSLCVQTEYLIVNIIEAYIIGAILVQLIEFPGVENTPYEMLVGVLIAAAILSFSVSLGGLWGSAFTNLIHCGTILVGLGLVGYTGMESVGGWGAMMTSVDGHLAAHDVDVEAWWGFAGAGWGAVLGMFFSASIHTPAASVYTNFATAARSERELLPAFLMGGAVASLMPLLAGFVGMVTLATYGMDSGLKGYRNLTQLAMDLHPLIGGVALAAILAAVISSGAPILLASATLFVNDWMPKTKEQSAQVKLKTYRKATVVYAIVSAVSAYFVSATKVSLLDLLLFGFAMVVPPAIAIGYLLYWKKTTERGAYWGIVLGYAGGLLWFVAIKVALFMEYSAGPDAGAMSRLLEYCFASDGRGVDPSYATTVVPLVLTPMISLMEAPTDDGEEFYRRISTAES